MTDDQAAPIRMRRDLKGAVCDAAWPVGVAPRAFRAKDARELHGLLNLAYGDGGGSVPAYRVWWAALARDAEYDPALVLLAGDQTTGAIVGAAQCWTSGFVKDLVVHPDWRQRGIGQALLSQVFGVFAAREFASVDLKVRPDNRRAQALYRMMGMKAVS